MTTTQPPRRRAHDPFGGPAPIARVLRAWLAAGIVLCPLFPALHGSGAWLGWLPIWLVATPLVGALLLAREPWREAQAFARVWVPKRSPVPAQARRIARPRRGARAA